MKDALKIEWQPVEAVDADHRLLRVFEILFDNKYVYEKELEDEDTV